MDRRIFDELKNSNFLIGLDFETSYEKIVSIIGQVLQITDEYVVFKTDRRTSYLDYKIIRQVYETNIIKATNETEQVSNLFQGNERKYKEDGDEK